jgi:hypothetical protein
MDAIGMKSEDSFGSRLRHSSVLTRLVMSKEASDPFSG